MSKQTPGEDVPVRRIDRILAFMSLGLVLLSVICFFATMLGTPLGVTDYSTGIWPVVVIVPIIALPLAFVLILTLLIMSFVRRARANKGR